MDNLLSKMKYYYPNAYYEVLERAYRFAKSAHRNQKRASGEEYFIHPYSVAEILVDLGLDTNTVAAALLHDVVEDTPVTREQLLNEFGQEICELVDGVTKLDKINFSSKEEEQADHLRKMFFAMAKAVRVVLIKLADRPQPTIGSPGPFPRSGLRGRRSLTSSSRISRPCWTRSAWRGRCSADPSTSTASTRR